MSKPGDAGAAEDVLSFLNSLDEMTAKPGSAAPRSSSPAKQPTGARPASGGTPPASASDVLNFLDEITAGTSQPSGAAPVSSQKTDRAQSRSPTKPPVQVAARSSMDKAPRTSVDGAAPPPVGGFVPQGRIPGPHAPRSRHIAPPEVVTATSPVHAPPASSFIPTPAPIGSEPLPPTPEPRQEEVAEEAPASTSKWSWGSILSTGTKLFETATQQVVQNVGVGEKAVVEQMKKMGLAPDRIREAGGQISSIFTLRQLHSLTMCFKSSWKCHGPNCTTSWSVTRWRADHVRLFPRFSGRSELRLR
jgi:hypothetical protein